VTTLPPHCQQPLAPIHYIEEVKFNLDAEWQYNELVLMAVDSGEEEWSRLHDVKLNGSVIRHVYFVYLMDKNKST
jgi:hypothetical protein